MTWPTIVGRLLWFVTELVAVIHVTIDHHLGFWVGFLIFDSIASLTAITYALQTKRKAA